MIDLRPESQRAFHHGLVRMAAAGCGIVLFLAGSILGGNSAPSADLAGADLPISIAVHVAVALIPAGLLCIAGAFAGRRTTRPAMRRGHFARHQNV